MNQESADLYRSLDTLRGDICELCNLAFSRAISTAEYVLEEVYEDTCYETVVTVNEDLTATVRQYMKVDDEDTRRWDLSKWEVCTHMEPVLVWMLKDFVATAKRVLDVTRDSRSSSPNTIEILGLLQLTHDKGSHVLSSFIKWENNHAEPLGLFVDSFRDYLLFLAERVVLRLEELAAQVKALDPVPQADLKIPAQISNGQGPLSRTARETAGRPESQEDEIHYSLQEGFTGITDRNKAIWAKRYPCIPDFDKEVTEIEEHLRQHPTEAEKVSARPRLYLDHCFAPDLDWTSSSGQTAWQPPSKTFAELAEKIEMKLDLDRTLGLDGEGFIVTPQEYANFRFAADKLRKSDPDVMALPEETGDPTTDMVCLMEYCQEEAERQLYVTGGAENGEVQERSNERRNEQEFLAGGTPRERPERTDCTHSDDFSSVVWYGVPYHFTATQASCVALLWAEWKKDPDAKLGLREKFIGEKISSSNENYRLMHTFRLKGKQHPAWRTMIHAKGDGFFYLGRPAATKNPSRKRKK